MKTCLMKIVTGSTKAYDWMFPTGIRKLSVIGATSISIHGQCEIALMSMTSVISELLIHGCSTGFPRCWQFDKNTLGLSISTLLNFLSLGS